MEAAKTKGTRRQFWALIVLLLLLCVNVLGTHEEGHVEEFDYASDDYSKINWNSFKNWDKIPPERIPDVPVEFLNYDLLNPAQRWQMNVEQVAANFNSIGNLATDVNPARARQAIREQYGVEVKYFGAGAKIQNDIFQATSGEQETLDIRTKEHWKITVDTFGRILVTDTAAINDASITGIDRFTVDGRSTYITQQGKGFAIEGLSFRGKQAYVRPLEIALVDSYDLSSPSGTLTVYFDQAPEAEENYALITESTLALGSALGNTVSATVRPGNQLFFMLKNEYDHDADGNPLPATARLVPDMHETLRFTVADGDSITVFPRREEGKIPLIQHEGAGTTQISTGRMHFAYQNNQWHARVESLPGIGGGIFSLSPEQEQEYLTAKEWPLSQQGSVAFELVSDAAEGQRILTSSSNRFLLMDSHGTVRVQQSSGLRVSDRLAHNQMKTLDDLRLRYPHIRFGIDSVVDEYTDISPHTAQFIDEWMETDPVARNLVKEIYMDTRGNAASLRFPDPSRAGVFLIGERVLTRRGYGPDKTDSALQVARHELRHGIDNYLAWHEAEDFSPEIIQQEGINSRYARVAQVALQRLAENPKFSEAVESMETLTGKRYRGTDINLYQIPSYFTDDATIGGKSRAEIEALNERYDAIVRETTGLDSYALREYDDVAGELRYSEMPTVFADIGDARIKQEIRKNNPVIILMTQIDYDAGIISEEKYHDLMGDYCRGHPCGRCVEYRLTCQSRPETVYYR